MTIDWDDNAGSREYAREAERARQLAAAAYRKPADTLPRELRDLDYDALRGMDDPTERLF